jgi:hypothetical protein
MGRESSEMLQKGKIPGIFGRFSGHFGGFAQSNVSIGKSVSPFVCLFLDLS